MCIICVSKSGICQPDESTIRTMFHHNPHGAGYMFARGGRVIITHCQNLELAQKLQSKILELWQSAKVSIMPTRGLCSYYAERNGLIVGYSQA